jgi:hypothetical protein
MPQTEAKILSRIPEKPRLDIVVLGQKALSAHVQTPQFPRPILTRIALNGLSAPLHSFIRIDGRDSAGPPKKRIARFG